MSKTLYLDPSRWDLVVDVNGNLAVASDPYGLAQDAACRLRTFVGDIYYDQTQGIDYFGLLLGQPVSLTLLKSTLAGEALKVPGVVSAQVFISAFDPIVRQVSGQVQITDATGTIAAASF
jgi:hypothetical protein